jgi:hypothetical protein
VDFPIAIISSFILQFKATTKKAARFIAHQAIYSSQEWYPLSVL